MAHLVQQTKRYYANKLCNNRYILVAEIGRRSCLLTNRPIYFQMSGTAVLTKLCQATVIVQPDMFGSGLMDWVLLLFILVVGATPGKYSITRF